MQLEAEINYPEESGIVQIESFGVHMNMDGTVFNGLKVESSENLPSTHQLIPSTHLL